MKRAKLLQTTLLIVFGLVLLAGCSKQGPTTLEPLAKPPNIPAWHNGEVVTFTVVSENVVGIDKRGIREAAAIPIYAFGPPGNQPQFDVLSAIPGEKGYNPWWHVFFVVVLNGRDVSADPFTSEAELLTASSAGGVALVDADFFFLCQVLPNH